MLRVFIGWDDRESIAYHVLAHSILRRASRPVAITPLVKRQVPEYTRPRHPLESTDFSLTRFLVPYLCNYEGTALFLDCDLLCLADLYDLLIETGQPSVSNPAVWVAPHDYVPVDAPKFLNQAQTQYRRKNWSSVMLFNNAQCRALTPEYVNTATGLALHQLDWAHTIGTFSLDWNWLVGEYAPNPRARMLHYTRGGPWFPAYETCDHADLWFAERKMMGA